MALHALRGSSSDELDTGGVLVPCQPTCDIYDHILVFAIVITGAERRADIVRAIW